MELELSINQRVDQFFKNKNISQQIIAADLGVSRQAVNNWLSGNNPIPARHLIKLLTDFETLNPRWVLNGTGEMETNENSLPNGNIVLTKKDIMIELLTIQLKEKELQIAELHKEIGRLEERLTNKSE